MKDDMKFLRKLATSQHDHACKNYTLMVQKKVGSIFYLYEELRTRVV